MLARFSVCLLPAPKTAVKMNFSTLNGTARGGSDFIHTNGTLTFAAKQTPNHSVWAGHAPVKGSLRRALPALDRA